MNMKLTCVTCAAFCLLVAFVSAAEESADPSITSGDIKVSSLEQDGHGPLMQALLAPGEETTALDRQKRNLFKYKGGGYGKGGCGGSSCGGCSSCGGNNGGTWASSSSQSSAKSESGSYGRK
ncbi:uncharacterized protein [Halyomorpha halys]|uniref:uncharacterized protein n=1 Tax=Halyomorpha halys TaxID=286706 RepID=UPI0006D513B8|nr:uncharacterized protein LOC106680959 [Halyomorpha halys]